MRVEERERGKSGNWSWALAVLVLQVLHDQGIEGHPLGISRGILNIIPQVVPRKVVENSPADSIIPWSVKC